MEKDLVAISSHQGNKESKDSSSDKNIKKSKGISKSESDKKDKDPMDIEIVQRVIKQLTNEIINLKKNKGEGKKPFKPFFKKRTTLKSLLLQALIWKIILWKTIVISVMQIIQKKYAPSS